jgi:hypothetical protein
MTCRQGRCAPSNVPEAVDKGSRFNTGLTPRNDSIFVLENMP